VCALCAGRVRLRGPGGRGRTRPYLYIALTMLFSRALSCMRKEGGRGGDGGVRPPRREGTLGGRVERGVDISELGYTNIWGN
jgi:hypothetical protein